MSSWREPSMPDADPSRAIAAFASSRNRGSRPHTGALNAFERVGHPMMHRRNKRAGAGRCRDWGAVSSKVPDQTSFSLRALGSAIRSGKKNPPVGRQANLECWDQPA